MNKALAQQILCLLPIFMNAVMNNCTNSWMAYAVYFITQPNHRPSATMAQCGLMASFFQIGRISLAIPSGILLDKYGAKYIIIAIGCTQVVTWATLSLTSSLWLIYLVRFIQGCGAALTMSSGPNTVGELCSPRYRGTLFGILKVIGSLGSIVECLLASISSSYSVTVYATMGLSLFFFLTVPWIIESPYYLMRVSKHEESKFNLEKIRKGHSESEISAEYESLKQCVEEQQLKKSERNWLQYLVLPSTRKPLICCILMNFLIFANGNHILSVYSSVILPPTKYFSENSYPLILAVVQLVSSMSSVLLIDALPRKNLFILSGFLSFMIQACNGIVYYEYSIAVEERQRYVLQLTFIIGALMFWALSQAVMDPLNMTLRSEILPVGIRGLGTSICMISQALSAVLCYEVYTFVQAYFGTAMNFAVFAVDSLLIIVVAYFFVPETRGKTLAEVQKNII